MAYQSKNLSVIAYANGFTLWHYTTIDPAATVDTVGYFNSASDMLRVGDIIMINASMGPGLMPSALVRFVAANNGGVVVIEAVK